MVVTKVFVVTQNGNNFSLQGVPNYSQAQSIPLVSLTSGFSITSPIYTDGAKLGFEISLSTGTAMNATGAFQVSVSVTGESGSFVPVLTPQQGAVAANLFTASGLNNVLLNRGPNTFNYVQVTWSGTSTTDKARIVFQMEK